MRSLLIIFMVGMLAGGEACSFTQRDDDIRIVTTGMKRGAWLGVALQDVTERMAEKKKLTVKEGALITEVMDESPAEKAGIQEGDVVVKFDEKQVEDSGDLTKRVQKMKPGDAVSLEVIRNGEHKTLKVTLEKRPRDQNAFFAPGAAMGMTLPHVSPKVRVFVSSRSEMLGLELQELGRQLAEYFEVPGKKGVLVTDVEKNSDASKAGFVAGDVISKVNNANVSDVDDVMEEVRDAKSGSEISFDVIRKTKSVSLKIVKKEADEGENEEDSFDFENFNRSNGAFWKGMNDHSRYKDEMLRFREQLLKMKSELHENLGKLREAIIRKIDFRHS